MYPETILERKEIYERRHPETKKGAIVKKLSRDENGRFTVKSNGDFTDIESFVKNTSKQIGISEITIKEDIQIAREKLSILWTRHKKK